jgi:hypothetical protein
VFQAIDERDIFGGSDSELSSDEEGTSSRWSLATSSYIARLALRSSIDIQRQKNQRRRDSPGHADDYADSGGEDYREARTASKKQRRPKATRPPGVEGEPAPRKRKRRERERVQEEENLDDLTPEQRA